MAKVLEERVSRVNASSARGQERIAKILDAATELFFRDGFSHTSVDAIVLKSGGSKATLYSYYPTKADLFRAVVDRIVASSAPPMPLDTCEHIRAALQQYGEARLALIFSERHQTLLRLVISERDRFPDLAETYNERGPKMSREMLISYLTALRNANKLDIDDVAEAAETFVGLLLHGWYRDHLLFNLPRPSPDEITERAARTADRFLAIYRRD